MVSGGFVLEAVAMAGMASYRLRQRLYRLSINNPLALQSLGCCTFVTGAVITVLGQWLYS